jgi:Aspartyl protease/Tetratricopeptide repeat
MKKIAFFIVMLTTASTFAQQPLADTLFVKGKFAEAEKVYETLLANDPNNIHNQLQLIRLALFSNQLTKAESNAANLLSTQPDDSVSNLLMAEILHRQDKYLQSAQHYRKGKRLSHANLMSSFEEGKAYTIEKTGKGGLTKIKFIHTDPLPLISISVNGSEELNFIIDTGGSDIILDKEVATKLNLPLFGSVTGTFAGSRKAPVELSKAESIRIGDLLVKNVPLQIMNTKPYSQVAGGKPVSGILGTVFFYHFITTLDYKNGQLIFADKKQGAMPGKCESLPFWMASTHIMVTPGYVNKYAEPLMLFVDTGLAMSGVGFTCPESTLTLADLKPIQGEAVYGQGGGGPVKVIPFFMESLKVGDINRKNMMGITGAFPKSLESSLGFKINGLVSHEFFRGSILTFDFTQMRMCIQ